MLTSEERREEAGRLLSLDGEGLEIEAVALALRMADQSETAMKELEELDREFVQMLDERHGHGQADPSTAGEMEEPDVEPLGT